MCRSCCIAGLIVVVALAGFVWFLFHRTGPVVMTRGTVLWATHTGPKPRTTRGSAVIGATSPGVYMLRLDSSEGPWLVHSLSDIRPVVFSVDDSLWVGVTSERTSSSSRRRTQYSHLLFGWRTGSSMSVDVPDGELLSLRLGRSLALIRKDPHVYRARVRVESSRIVVLPGSLRVLAPLPNWAHATLSPSGRYVLIHDRGHQRGHATIRSASDGAIVTDFPAHSAQFLREGDGWFQVVYTKDGRLFLFDSRGKQTRVLATDIENERLVAASPDGRWVVTTFRTADWREILRGYQLLEHSKLRIRSVANGKIWRTWTAGDWVGPVVAASSD